MQGLRNIIVTGSNKGIGFAIAQQLASEGKWNIIMAVRNLQLGEKAKQTLLNLQRLDISEEQSIQNFIEVVKAKYHKIDVLVNNAGVAVKGDAFDSEVVKFTFATNVYGTISLTKKCLPLLVQNGKIVTLGSMAGKFSFYKLSEQLRLRFQNVNLTETELFDLGHEFQRGVEDGTYEKNGWPKSGYGISKLIINVYHRILAKEELVKQKNIQVYVCCPGYVKTDMTSHKGHLTLEEGIKTPMFLINLPFQVNPLYQGQFFQVEKLSSTFA